MKCRSILGKGVAGLLLVAIGGCYEYPKPPVATMGNVYSNRVNRDSADDLLKDIKSLTITEAQRIAILNNPTYIAAYYAVEAARMKYYQSLGAFAPEVTASFGLSESNKWTRNAVNTNEKPVRTDTFSTSTGVQASWLLFNGLSRYYAMKISESNWDYQKMLDENDARTLMYSVAQAYNQVLLAIENKRIAEENRVFQESSLRDTQLKFDAGAVPLSDVLNFAIQMNNADSSMIQADYQYETAIYTLAVLMGYPEGTLPDGILFPSDFKTNFAELGGVDVFLNKALANRPDLKAYREQLKIAQYQVYQTYGSYSPTVTADFSMSYGTGLSRMYGNYGTNHTYSETPSLSYGISANWMIFNGLTRYNKMREAQANVAIADYTVAAQWMTVVGEVRAAYSNYVQSVRQARIYEKIRELSAQQRDLVDDSYKAGNTELTRLNEAQRDLVEAETNLASSYIDIQNAKAQLDAATALNSVAYYKNGGKDVQVEVPVISDTPQSDPQAAPSENVIPGVTGPGMSAAFPAPGPVSTTTPDVALPTPPAPTPADKTPPPIPANPTVPAGVPVVVQP